MLRRWIYSHHPTSGSVSLFGPGLSCRRNRRTRSPTMGLGCWWDGGLPHSTLLQVVVSQSTRSRPVSARQVPGNNLNQTLTSDGFDGFDKPEPPVNERNRRRQAGLGKRATSPRDVRNPAPNVPRDSAAHSPSCVITPDLRRMGRLRGRSHQASPVHTGGQQSAKRRAFEWHGIRRWATGVLGALRPVIGPERRGPTSHPGAPPGR